MLNKLVRFVTSLLEPHFANETMILNRYKVIKHLGSGSYGRSYLVYDLESKCKVVLKALRLHKRLSYAGRNSFAHEMELLKKLHHEGFPKFNESGIYKRTPFYTMEHIEGKNFEQLIFHEGNHYTEIEAFNIAKKLLSLIQYLHSMKIIHRDIRIPNVIMNGSKIWLIDLGLAVENAEIRAVNNRNLRRSTHEQADFYSFGHFLLFLLYSNYSFQKRHKEKSWEEELTISPIAKQIIRKLLQLQTPYENCGEIEKDIQSLISEEVKKDKIFS